ncbi:MAG: hypothetical protein NWF07_13475 [Candidatus Bathyarchaeota archaeon]|nr:hypothetical protein [Candidatus Bathyarchaeota archaeon]
MTRRHRIFETEITPTIRAIHQRLTKLNTSKEINHEKQQLFRLLWRLHQHRTGPPHYPEITRDEIDKLLDSTRHMLESD